MPQHAIGTLVEPQGHGTLMSNQELGVTVLVDIFLCCSNVQSRWVRSVRICISAEVKGVVKM